MALHYRNGQQVFEANRNDGGVEMAPDGDEDGESRTMNLLAPRTGVNFSEEDPQSPLH